MGGFILLFAQLLGFLIGWAYWIESIDDTRKQASLLFAVCSLMP